jgi:Holliday junction resolvasome RuvABC endonuclease subunit
MNKSYHEQIQEIMNDNPFEKAKEIVINKGASIGPSMPNMQLISSLKEQKKTHILSLDVATNTGFCTRNGSGVWNLSPKKDESKGMRLIRFKAKLKDICAVEEINIIVFEGAVSYVKFPNMVGVEMIGVLKLFCEENSIEYRSYMPTEIKKFATGRGNAKKDLMISEAQRKYLMSGNDDNQADALHLYHYALKDLDI